MRCDGSIGWFYLVYLSMHIIRPKMSDDEHKSFLFFAPSAECCGIR